MMNKINSSSTLFRFVLIGKRQVVKIKKVLLFETLFKIERGTPSGKNLAYIRYQPLPLSEKRGNNQVKKNEHLN